MMKRFQYQLRTPFIVLTTIAVSVGMNLGFLRLISTTKQNQGWVEAGYTLMTWGHINGDRDLRLSVILDGDNRFDFDSVRRISADRSGAKITKISITSYGYSKEKAAERFPCR